MNPSCPLCKSNKYVTLESPLKDIGIRPDEWVCSACDFAWLKVPNEIEKGK